MQFPTDQKTLIIIGVAVLAAVIGLCYTYKYDFGTGLLFAPKTLLASADPIIGEEASDKCLYYFHQANCPSCNDSGPMIDKLERELSSNGKSIEIKRVNCAPDKLEPGSYAEGLVSKYSVSGTPYIVFQESDRFRPYGKETITTADLLKFIAD